MQQGEVAAAMECSHCGMQPLGVQDVVSILDFLEDVGQKQKLAEDKRSLVLVEIGNLQNKKRAFFFPMSKDL